MTQPFLSSATIHKIGSLPVKLEHDVVRARNIASLLAQEIEFDKTTCIRIGTTVSELSRNMLEHAQGGIIDFGIVTRSKKSPGLLMVFKDNGKGIENIEKIKSGTYKSKFGMGVGLSGSQRLMDDFDIQSAKGKGTKISAAKWLPEFHKGFKKERIDSIVEAFKKTIERGDSSMVDTINAQNHELQFLLRKLQERNEDIETINKELEETNQGVVALNRELEDRAMAIEQSKQEAEEANKAKSEFLANMSHEIRTPMNAILGFTEILESKITDKNLLKYLSSISSSGKALLNIINDILDLSKIEAGKMDLNYQTVNLYSVLNEIGQIFKHKTQKKKISFLLDIDPEVPRQIAMDDVRLRQILFNLVGNAVKFTDRGHVKLSVTPTNINQADAKADLHFEVADTGVGIAESQITNIFKAFEQQSNQDLNKYGGTGLGLTITSRLVKMMDGEIDVKSKVGAGSTFSVFLKNLEIITSEKKEEKEKIKSEGFNDSLKKPFSGKELLDGQKEFPTYQEFTDATKEEIHKPKQSNSVSNKNLPKLLDLLNNKYRTKWETIRKTFIIGEIITFAGEIKKLGKDFQAEPLTKWGEDLLDQANSFDMENLPSTLNQFEDVIAGLSKKK